jgi:dipeptidyl aminopeptidase/acylaminoacyl peptidase
MNAAPSSSGLGGHRNRRALQLFALLVASICAATALAAETSVGVDEQSTSPQFRRGGGDEPGVYKGRIEPHWFAENAKFWYRNRLPERGREFIVVDAEQGERRPAFDHERLAESLAEAAGRDVDARRLPFDEIDFSDDGAVVQFDFNGARWACQLDSYKCWKLEDEEPSEADDDDDSPRQGRGFGRRRRGGFGGFGQGGDENRGRSPNGQWRAVVRDDNIYIRPENAEGDGEDGDEFQLTDDGSEQNTYGQLQWSPDSTKLVAFRMTPGDRFEVYLLESSPRGGGRARMRARPYALPGDKFNTYEVNVFDVEAREQTKPETDRLEMEWGQPRVRWDAENKHVRYSQVDRGHQRYRVVDVDAETGEVRNIVDERSETFIWTAHTENLGLDIVTWLEHSEEFLYSSEQNGWRSLYLVDADDGIKNQITENGYVVRGLEWIDEANRQIWFYACGKNPDQDPYFIHYYRVNFDGTDLVELTEGDGNHSVQFSPDRKYLIDTYSRVDAPPVHTLRRASDGSLVCKLEETDISELEERGWKPPEVFVAKGRDGETDIWGIICRPRDFDPDKKYPVIEQIYAGPQGSFTPKNFSAFSRFQALTDLGFIVVQMDGMGTANRSKAFHDECWHDLKDAGFEDRILWMKAAAKEHPEMDLERVGIYGGSAGGQNAAAAVLFHPEFYKVACAGCGCHDNRMDKASWNEQWMGYPVGPQYAECSNIDNAHRLEGKLMLILGELDNNVPVESTYRLVDALIKAEKDFDFVLVPGAGHGMGGQYGTRRMHDFFVRHLQGKEPPNRNAPRENDNDQRDEES